MATKKVTNDLAAQLADIAGRNDFPETLKPAELVGKTFVIDDVRTVDTENGARFIGMITLDGKPCDAWLTGSKVHAQIEEVLIHNLPCTVTLTKEEGQFAPYLLEIA